MSDTRIFEGHKYVEPPAGVPEWDIDPYAPEVLAAPEEFYRELRAKGPFVYLTKYAMLACGRYDETRQVFSDWENFVSSRGVGLQDFRLEEPWRPPSRVLEADPPDHDTFRKVIVRCMAPNVVASLRASFREAADRLIDSLIETDGFDGVTDLAQAFPTEVFPAAVGMKDNDQQRLIDYGVMVFNALGPDNAARRAAMARAPEVVPWITAACQAENLTGEGIGGIIYEAAKTHEISEEDAGMLVRSLFSAGIDTTISGLASALWCLAENPDALATLKDNPKLARPCFEEAIRFVSPVHSFCRTADTDVEVSGVTIEEGTKVLCVLASANRDEDKWPQAATFKIDRRPMGHLAFGVGIHHCPGQNIARAEGEAVLLSLADKVNAIKLTGKPSWQVNNAVRAPKSLPMEFVV